MSKLVTIPNVRLAFVHLHEPRVQKDDNGNPKHSYEVSVLLHKTRHAAFISKMNGEIAALIADKKWPRNTVKSVCMTEASEKVSAETGEPYAGFDDQHLVVSTRAPVSRRPRLVDAQNIDLDGKGVRFYSGCYADIQIDLYAYDKDPKHGRRICASPNIVRFRADGEPLGIGMPDPAAAFADIDQSSIL